MIITPLINDVQPWFGSAEFSFVDTQTENPSFILRLLPTTGFQTTYPFAFSGTLAKIYWPNENQMIARKRDISICFFGCGVHAKRTIMKEVSIVTEDCLCAWATATRRLTNAVENEHALRYMEALGGKRVSFSTSFRQNYAVYVLWSQSFRKVQAVYTP